MTDRSAFTDRTPRTVTLPDGREVTARVLTFRDQRCLEQAHPAPTPPMKRAPGGSLAPEEPDTKDPAYVDAYNAWSDEETLLRAAVIVGYRPEIGGTPTPWEDARGADIERMARWCAAVIDELGELVSYEWARAVNNAAVAADLRGVIEGGGKGNSGAPSDGASPRPSSS